MVVYLRLLIEMVIYFILYMYCNIFNVFNIFYECYRHVLLILKTVTFNEYKVQKLICYIISFYTFLLLRNFFQTHI